MKNLKHFWKNAAVAFVLLISTSNLYSQVTDTGDEVGVGTTTPALKLHVNGSILGGGRANGLFNSSSNGTALDGRESLILPGSTSQYLISVQDGNGRIQHKWNATYGTNEKFLVGGEDASLLDWSATASGSDPWFEFKFADGAGKNAGDAINWTTNLALLADGNTTVNGKLNLGTSGTNLDGTGGALRLSGSNGTIMLYNSGSDNLIYYKPTYYNQGLEVTSGDVNIAGDLNVAGEIDAANLFLGTSRMFATASSSLDAVLEYDEINDVLYSTATTQFNDGIAVSGLLELDGDLKWSSLGSGNTASAGFELTTNGLSIGYYTGPNDNIFSPAFDINDPSAGLPYDFDFKGSSLIAGKLTLNNTYGTNLMFEPASNRTYRAGVADNGGSGIALRIASNPSDQAPIFQVRSSGQASRFFVEHNGYTGGENAAYFKGFNDKPHIFDNKMVIGDDDDDEFDNSPYYADYDLWVHGGIVSRDFAFADVADWEDRVFEESYELASLEEIEDHILQNKHLHTMPSEQEIIENGYTIHDMNKRMLRTIEELTLHTIGQAKKIKSQKEMIQNLAKRLEVLEGAK